MTSLIWNAGTITVTNGSALVTGSGGTGWKTAAVRYGTLEVGGRQGVIASVEDEAELTLAQPWAGPNYTGAYVILRRDSAAADLVGIYDKFSQSVIRHALSTINPSGVGSLTKRDALTLTDDDEDFVWLHAEDANVGDWQYYVWGGTVDGWIGPQPVTVPGEASVIPGPPGPGLTPAGEYEAGSTYALGDYVQFNGRTFSSLQAGNIGHQPPNADEDNAWWMWTPAAQGEPGEPVEFNVSPTHIQWRYVGDVSWTNLVALADLNGEDGAAATVEVGAVTTLNVGQSASVTNVGTSAAAVLDFAIPTGATGGVRYNFSTTTTDSDPGAGIVRFNHATFGSVTYVYFDNLALGSADVTAWLDSFDDSNMSGDKGYLLAQGATNPNISRLFRVTGAVIDGTGYRKVPVAPIASGGAVSNSLPLAWSFYRTGDKGADGLGAGDMLKATYDPTSKNADAFARANHTGTQLASTISDFSTAADARVSAAIGSTVQAYDADLASWAGITRASGFDTFAATPSSTNLRALLTDEVGTGAAYFVGGALGTPASATLTNATGLPVSGIAASTSAALGVGSVELGHATDTTLARSSAGDVSIEGNLIYRAGGTDVPITDGGTGASNASGARANLGIGSMAERAVTISTSNPSGGADGDVWLKYTP